MRNRIAAVSFNVLSHVTFHLVQSCWTLKVIWLFWFLLHWALLLILKNKRQFHFGRWTGDIHLCETVLFDLLCFHLSCLPRCQSRAVLYYISEFYFPFLSLGFLIFLSLIVCKNLLCWPPVILGEVVEDVHLVVILQKAVGRADMVTLQHWAVIVQDSCVWSVKEKTKELFHICLQWKNNNLQINNGHLGDGTS